MSDINYIEIGKNIKTRRKEKGYSQKKLAELIGLEYRTLLKWEKGNLNHKIDFPVFLKLCDVLEIDVPYLLGNEYSTRELETVCKYTGLSEHTAKMLHDTSSYSGEADVQNVSAFLSDLVDNYDVFSDFLVELQDYMCSSYLEKVLPTIKPLPPAQLFFKYRDQAALNLLQCQRLIDGLKNTVENDSYIKSNIVNESPLIREILKEAKNKKTSRNSKKQSH